MNNRLQTAFDAWRSADAEAKGHEVRLAQAWHAFFDQEAGPPNEELFVQVTEARRHADEKLSAVLRTLRVSTNEGHPR